MRTTLDIEKDVLAVAKGLARRHGTSDGQVESRLLLATLSGDTGSEAISGFRPFRAAPQKLVTNEQIDQFRDRDGL